MITIEDLLPQAKNISGRPSYVCPKCGNGSGQDGTGITEDPQRPGHYHCFKCGFDGDVFDIMDVVYNRQPGESYRDAQRAERPQQAQQTHKAQKPQQAQQPDNPEIEQYISRCAAAMPGSPGETYLKARGFTAKTISDFRLGYDKALDAVVIPYPGWQYYITRSLQGKEYRKPKGLPEPIFNAKALAGDLCFITEGQLDALSILQAGGQAAAIGGAGDHKLKDYAGNLADKIFIVADNDEPGEKTAQRIKAAVEDRTHAHIIHPPKEYKDANDFLKDNEPLFTALVYEQNWLSWEYQENSSAAAYIKDFWTDAKTKTPATATGFSELDKTLAGGLFEGLYIIGAVSSLGKTTYCLQMAEQIARYEKQDVIIFSLEMARSELIAKSLSRLSLELCGGKTNNAKTARAITDPDRINAFTPEERELMNQATAVYSSYAKRLWINEGLGTIGVKEIREKVSEHIEYTGNRPIVIIDYLQILTSPDPHLSDKQATDRNVFELKRMSRDYKIPVIAVSSFNRDNYSTAINMAAFKESGAIEYSSDVLLGLQPQGMTDKAGDSAKAENAKTVDSCKRADTRQLELKILKNRNGKTGETVLYQYTPMFNYFQESTKK